MSDTTENKLQIKVNQTPGNIYNVQIDAGGRVADALRAANVNVPSGATITVNGVEATIDTELSNCDRVYIAMGAKGNA